ncbi:unnamed protein product [Acanthoscelides obtectus]|uniref:Uncharacterized protein n=1 Tax=Acanthoscelides obtectus TaxID=200917 RepID=A0A9P0KS78_ACAOB|nr:unnamed protein product [Acanthoscelides obtectus]CAK1628561.1 hypothetical protein AOBTE_LOCUS5273 [Acanthoscelides obtectus]
MSDSISDEVASDILAYLESSVDMSLEQDGNLNPVMEELQEIDLCLAHKENVPLVTQELPSTSKDQTIDGKTASESTDEERTLKDSGTVCDDPLEIVKPGEIATNKRPSRSRTKKPYHYLLPPSMRKRKISPYASDAPNKKRNEPVMSLVDIAAHYVVKNGKDLMEIYNLKQSLVHKMIESKLYSKDQVCRLHKVSYDLRKKIKLLRVIEIGDIPEEIVEEYILANTRPYYSK